MTKGTERRQAIKNKQLEKEEKQQQQPQWLESNSQAEAAVVNTAGNWFLINVHFGNSKNSSNKQTNGQTDTEPKQRYVWWLAANFYNQLKLNRTLFMYFVHVFVGVWNIIRNKNDENNTLKKVVLLNFYFFLFTFLLYLFQLFCHYFYSYSLKSVVSKVKCRLIVV